MRPLDDPERLEALELSGLLTKSMPERIDHLAFAACHLLVADACQINALNGTIQHTVVGYPPGDWLDMVVEDTGCKEPVRTGQPFVVPDSHIHPVTCDMPWAQQFRGYMGAPIAWGGNLVVGSICVLTEKPRPWKTYEVTALVGVARLVSMSLDGV